MKSIVSAILVLSFLDCQSQLSVYKFSAQIDSVRQRDTVPWKNQSAAWDYSFIGEYLEALETFEADSNERATDTREAVQAPIGFPRLYKAIPAKAFIVEQAKATRIVIINEAHHISRHRVFTESLLPGLRELGYTFIGIETLGFMDSGLMIRKYPIMSTGFYSKEPSFGNLIRTAIESDYTVFPYEAPNDAHGSLREIAQAENIKRILDANPQGKFIIYCGFGHVAEDSVRSAWGLAMAGRLKRLTGINPLTIDQVQLTETGNPLTDNQIRRSIHEGRSVVFQDKGGRVFNKANALSNYDVNVYHPDTQYKYGRPDWLQNDNKVAVKVASKIKIACPCLVSAYLADEDSPSAVPVDVIELQGRRANKRLILRKGRQHKIIVRNMPNERQEFAL